MKDGPADLRPVDSYDSKRIEELCIAQSCWNNTEGSTIVFFFTDREKNTQLESR